MTPASVTPPLLPSAARSEISDAPLAHFNQDRLERKDFALRLARTLAERAGDRGYVVGLYGRWGEGKSTVLNFVKQALTVYPTDRVAVVEFNPWFDSDETHLYAEFLDAISTAVGVKLERPHEKAIRRATQASRFAEGIPFTEKANSVVKVAKLLGAIGGLGQPTLRDFHDRLYEVLAAPDAIAARRRIVILMDDIDRLDNAQIGALFRMVKLAADFPNLCFLLAFDDDVVAEALGTRYRSAGAAGGHEFLEKIINAPLRLPRADPSVAAQVLRELLEGVLVANGISPQAPGERVRLDDALDAAVWPRVTSLRQGKRLLSKIDFALPIMAGEVNPADQVLMEALLLLYPSLHAFAANNKSSLLSSPTSDQGRDLRSKLDELSQQDGQEGVELLQRLFPHLQALYTSRRFGPSEQQQWIRDQRVCSPSHFDRYFAYGLPVGDILDSEITSVIAEAPPRNISQLQDLFRAYDPGLVIRKLGESTIPSAGAAMRLAHALTEILPVNNTDVLFRAGGLLRRLLEVVAPTERLTAARDLLEEAPTYVAAIVFTWLEAPHYDPDEGQPILSQPDTEQLGGRIADRVLGSPPDQLISRGSQTGLLPYGVCLRYRPGQAQQHLIAALKSDPGLLDYLLSLYLGVHQVAFLSALTRTGYERLTELLPAEEFRTLVLQHHPAAEDTLASLPLGSTGQPELPVDSDDYAVLAFLAAFEAVDTREPTTPSTVFEPTAQNPSNFRNASPHHLTQSGAAFVPLTIRSAVALPRQLGNVAGERTSDADDQARIAVLRRVVEQTGLTQSLLKLLSTPPWQTSTLPGWDAEGGSGREAAKLFCGSLTDEAPGFSLSVQMETGRAATGSWPGSPAEPGIFATLDLILRMPKSDRRLTLEELRDLLVDVLQLHRAMTLAAADLLPGVPESGEGVLYLAAQEDLGNLIDLEVFGPHRSSRSEIPVYYHLPLRPAKPDILQLASSVPSPEAQLAIEAIKRTLLWTGRQGYAPSLNQLLRSSPR